MWSFAATANLLQGSTYCKFKNELLHNSVVTSYLSYWRLPISRSPLTSSIKKTFPTREHQLTPLKLKKQKQQQQQETVALQPHFLLPRWV